MNYGFELILKFFFATSHFLQSWFSNWFRIFILISFPMLACYEIKLSFLSGFEWLTHLLACSMRCPGNRVRQLCSKWRSSSTQFWRSEGTSEILLWLRFSTFSLRASQNNLKHTPTNTATNSPVPWKLLKIINKYT